MELDIDNIVNSLYDPNGSGIIVLHNFINPDNTNSIYNYLMVDCFDKYVGQPAKYGSTYQGFSKQSIDNFNNQPIDILFRKYKLLRDKIASKTNFAKYDYFDGESLYYKKGSIGIGPHVDHSFCVNIKSIFIIKGVNPFCTAKNKKLDDLQRFEVKPGSLILMRCPRNRTKKELKMRPVHFVEQILEDRVIIIIQEIDRNIEQRIKKIFY